MAFPGERQVTSVDAAVAAAEELGHPVVLKLGGAAIAHKTERGLVRLGLADGVAVAEAAESLLAAARPEDGEVHVLVAPMVKDNQSITTPQQTNPITIVQRLLLITSDNIYSSPYINEDLGGPFRQGTNSRTSPVSTPARSSAP